MLVVAVILNLLAAMILFAMAGKYLTSAPPLDYHAEILAKDPPNTETKLILGALYKGLGGSFAALGGGTVLISVFGIWNDLLWAKLTLILMGLVAGLIASQAARAVESATGVRTPWRIAAATTGLFALAFILSLI